MSTDRLRFDRRAVVVTGAAAGIGRAVASAFIAEGASVLLVDRDAAGLDTAVAGIAAGDRCRTFCVDLAESGACAGVVPAAVAAFGRVDVLVNNAADVGRRVTFAELTDGEWDRVLATNLTAAALLGRDAAREMAGAGGGCIVNVTSIQAHLPLDRHLAYVASKGGLEALTRAMAVELADSAIRVNAVAPGVIETPGMASERDAAGTTSEAEPATLSGRSGTAADVAAAILFLASADAGHITGTTLTVDGGRRLSRRPDPLAARSTRPTTIRTGG